MLTVVERMGLEGVVSKRRTLPYVSGRKCGWINVKSRSSREANKDRGELLHGRKEKAQA